MPMHDWTRVDAGIFHDFHLAWMVELRNALNGGLLPSGFYALTEQHAGRRIPDLIALHDTPPETDSRRRTLAIRHVSGHRLVAVVEMVSPATKTASNMSMSSPARSTAS
jgi:hypothetical protein